MKKFYCRSPVLIFIYAIAISIFVVCLWYIVGMISGEFRDNTWKCWFALICAIIGICIAFLMILHTAIKNLIFDEEKISVKNDIKIFGVIRRLQYAVVIKYSDIKKVFYKELKTDSLGHEVSWIFVRMPYLFFECKDGKQKAINLYYFSKGQRKRIISEVIRRVEAVGNKLNVSSAEELLQNK